MEVSKTFLNKVPKQRLRGRWPSLLHFAEYLWCYCSSANLVWDAGSTATLRYLWGKFYKSVAACFIHILYNLTYKYFTIDDSCSRRFNLAISQHGFTVHPADIIRSNLSAKSLNIKVWVLFIWADRHAELSEGFLQKKKKQIHTVLWTVASLVQFANSVVLISALKLRVCN